MRVCLINPPTRKGSLRPPLGLMYISSYLTSKGIDNIILEGDTDLVKIAEYKPDFVGISCLTTDVMCVLNLAKLIKERINTKIVLGGIHPTLFPKDMLKDKNVDYVIQGEGEMVLYNLVIGRIAQAYKVMQSNLVNLDTLPFPAYDKIDMEFYLQPNIHLIRGVPLRGFYIFTSRGCPYRCRFCVNKNIFGRKIRFREPSSVVKEILYLYKRYEIDGFYFYDDTFAVNKRLALEICDLLIDLKLPLVWGCETRVNLLTEDLIKKMKQAGCIQIDLGIETGSWRLLELLQKDITLEEIRKAVRLCKKYHIRVFSNFMVNLPTETKEDVEKTLELADTLKSDISIFNVTCPFPGTDIQNYLKAPLELNDYPKMASMTSYNTYIDFLENKCKLSAHNIPIRDILKRIQDVFPSPRNMIFKPKLRYIRNFLRYFSFLNLRYLSCILHSKHKRDYLKFIFKMKISTTKE